MEEEEEEVVLLRLGDDIGTVDYEDLVSVGIVWWLWWRSKLISIQNGLKKKIKDEGHEKKVTTLLVQKIILHSRDRS